MSFIHQKAPLILASTSPHRRQVLDRSGLAYTAIRPEVDEEALKPRLAGLSPADKALALAEAKGAAVAGDRPDALVVSGDQIVAGPNGTIYDKPGTRAQAVADLMALSGQTMALYSALVLFADGALVWRHVTTSQVRFRAFTAEEAEMYTQMEDVTSCAGSCKIEGLGIHLIAEVNGDQDAIIGLPLAPLLAELYACGAVTMVAG